MNPAFAPALLEHYLPRLDQRVRDILLILGGSLLVALMAQVKIPLPFTPVPLTGQTFAVLLVGAALGSRRGAASLLLYLAQGMLGLPVFAGGAGGPAYLFGPTGGYLVGFVCAAFLVGRLAENGQDKRFRTALLVFLVGELVIYLCGVSWLAVHIGFEKALTAGLLPFLPGDAVKLLAAALALPAAWKLIPPADSFRPGAAISQPALKKSVLPFELRDDIQRRDAYLLWRSTASKPHRLKVEKSLPPGSPRGCRR